MLFRSDASVNLQHYFGNIGDPQSMNVDKMLADQPDLSNKTSNKVTTMAEKAVDKAQESGATGPVTYPFTTAWDSTYATTQNWFYATGGYNYATDGTVTVYPPSDDNPEWTYKYDYRIHTTKVSDGAQKEAGQLRNQYQRRIDRAQAV